MYNTVATNSIGHAILSVVFYLIMVGIVLYSLIALYTLLRFGRDRILAIIVSLLYLIISAGLYAAAVGSLNNIKF